MRSLVREDRAVFILWKNMGYKDQLKAWLQKHPDATAEEAIEAGYMISTDNWCHGKVELMDKCVELMKQIINK